MRIHYALVTGSLIYAKSAYGNQIWGVKADLPPDHMSKESVLVSSPVFPVKNCGLMQSKFPQYLLDLTSQYIH